MPADVLVWLRCPGCKLVWHAATIRPGTYWAKGASPERVALQVHCPRCDHGPPMEQADALPLEGDA
jgi:hypothetical protein